MKLDNNQKDELIEKAYKILHQLNTTEFGLKATALVLTTEYQKSHSLDAHGFRVSDAQSVGYFKKIHSFIGSDIYRMSHLNELINCAKQPIEEMRYLLNIKPDNRDVAFALQQLDMLEIAYREIEKDQNTSELSQQLKQLDENQKKMLKLIDGLVKDQAEIKNELKNKATKLDIPSIPMPTSTFSLERKIDNLSEAILSVRKTVDELNASEKDKEKKSHHSMFGFGSKK